MPIRIYTPNCDLQPGTIVVTEGVLRNQFAGRIERVTKVTPKAYRSKRYNLARNAAGVWSDSDTPHPKSVIRFVCDSVEEAERLIRECFDFCDKRYAAEGEFIKAWAAKQRLLIDNLVADSQ